MSMKNKTIAVITVFLAGAVFMAVRGPIVIGDNSSSVSDGNAAMVGETQEPMEETVEPDVIEEVIDDVQTGPVVSEDAELTVLEVSARHFFDDELNVNVMERYAVKAVTYPVSLDYVGMTEKQLFDAVHSFSVVDSDSGSGMFNSYLSSFSENHIVVAVEYERYQDDGAFTLSIMGDGNVYVLMDDFETVYILTGYAANDLSEETLQNIFDMEKYGILITEEEMFQFLETGELSGQIGSLKGEVSQDLTLVVPIDGDVYMHYSYGEDSEPVYRETTGSWIHLPFTAWSAVEGSQVRAMADGYFVDRGNDDEFGKYVTIRSFDDSYEIMYAGLSQFYVDYGSAVHQGDVIAYVGAPVRYWVQDGCNIFVKMTTAEGTVDSEQFIK